METTKDTVRSEQKQEVAVEDLPVADHEPDQVKAGVSGASGGVWKTTNF